MHKGREGAGTARGKRQGTIIAPTRVGNSDWEVPRASGFSTGYSSPGNSSLWFGVPGTWQIEILFPGNLCGSLGRD